MKLFYLSIYVYPYRISVYYFKGGEVNKNISEPLGGGESVETNKNAIGVV